MKRWWLLGCLGLLLGTKANAIPFPPLAVVSEARALSVEIQGKNGGFDSSAYEAVRHLISDLIADGTVDRFTVYRYYSNGGFAACIELGISTVATRLRELEQQLLGIPYDTATTAVFVGPERHCP